MIIMKKFENLWELPKCDTETWREYVVGKMVLIDLLNAELPQAFNLLKKKKKIISVKYNKARYACMVIIVPILQMRN